MVLAERRDVVDPDPVLLDADPVIVETADDRPVRGARRVGRAGDARLVEQRVAERLRLVAHDLAPRNHRHRREGVRGHGQDADRHAAVEARPQSLGAVHDRRRGRHHNFRQGDALRPRGRGHDAEHRKRRPGEELIPPAHRISRSGMLQRNYLLRGLAIVGKADAVRLSLAVASRQHRALRRSEGGGRLLSRERRGRPAASLPRAR